MYTWLPLYKEISNWILQYRNRQEELCLILRKIGFEGNLTDQNRAGETKLKVMDPLTFFAFFQKIKKLDNRSKYLTELKKIVGFQSPIPTDYNGLPSAQPLNLWFFRFQKDRKPKELDLLWDLAEQAIHGELNDNTFNAVLSMHGIGVAKLTQALFWLNPEKFYPIDAHKEYLEKLNIQTEIHSLDDYREVIKQIRTNINRPFYELSHEAWKHSQDESESDNQNIPNNTENSFLSRTRSFDQNLFNHYITFLQHLVKDIDLRPNDQRIVFTMRRNRLNFIVGQRYCINLYKEKAHQDIGFISSKKLQEYDGYFSGSTKAYYNRSTNADVLKKYKDDIYKAIQSELDRSKISGFLSSDDQEFRSLVFQLSITPITQKNNMDQRTLNRILYGPPGTGKTYLSKRLAISILEEKTIEEIIQQYPSSSAITEQFKKYQESGQVIFTTFHQSFSYEDFIEGIKPLITGDAQDETPDAEIESSGRIGYKVVPGVFKQIADQARSYKSSTSEGDTSSYILSKPIDTLDKTFFKMSLGNTQQDEGREVYNYCIANNCIALGWGGRIDFTKADTDEKVLSKFEGAGGARSRYEVTAMKCFRLWMKSGDIVLISDGNLLVRAIAQIGGDYYFDNKSPIGPKHFRKVTWLLKDARIPVNELYQKQFSQQTVYMLWDNEIKRDFFAASKIKQLKNPNHVIIIDEINRGNVSGIFGELITLIEEDKREGRKEAIEVKLPYSKEAFSVPDNLYIIGTMNTADRSVEALDTALRRRFDFEEMPPRYDLPQLNKKAGSHLLKDILQTINTRLEKLLDKDHMIGHSYLMFEGADTLSNLMESFYKNIIPLLQEYFFGDYGKIGLVLGKGFVNVKELGGNVFCDFQYDGVDMLLEKSVYNIIDYRNATSDLPPEWTFETALDILMQKRI